MKRITVLIGDTFVLGDNGTIRNHYPGAKYMGLKDTAFVAMEQLTVKAMASMAALAKGPKAPATDPRVTVLVGDVLVIGEGNTLRNHFPGPKYFGLKISAQDAMQAIWVQLQADLTALAGSPVAATPATKAKKK